MAEEKVVIKENRMGTMEINHLLISISLPMMISMLVQACYNVVDSYFVMQISERAMRAVSLAFPIQSLMIALTVGTSVGVNAFLSKTLGEKNFEKAGKIAVNGIFVEFISYVLFAVIGVLIAKPFFMSQTSDLEVVSYGVTYLCICCGFSFGIFMQMIFERILQSTGKTLFTMFTQGLGAIINIILDPILIFGLFGAPKLGIAGAAVATVTGQILAAVLAIFFNITFNKEVKLRFKGFRPDLELIKNIYKVGAPSIVMQAIGSVMVYGLNLVLASFGVAQTVFGLYFKFQSFVFMPVFGLNNGMVPIIAYNYGARKKERVIKTIKTAVVYAVGIMMVGLIIMEIFPKQLLVLFKAEGEVLSMGVPAFRIICSHFVLAGFCIVIGSVFQALGNGIYSMVVSICRQLLVLLPVAYLLSLSGNVNMIWWAFPIAELVSVTISGIFLLKIKKNVIDKL